MKERERVTKERELQLHERLLKADPIASSEIAELLLDYIVKVLRRLFPKQRDDAMYDEAAVQALMDYLQRPTAYDRTKSRLSSYLIRAAQADMKTLIARRARIHEFEKSLFVEDSETEGNKSIEVPDPSMSEESIVNTIDIAFARDQIFEVITDEKDRDLIRLMQDQVRETEEYAAVLRIQHLDLSEQRRIVKQQKDRLDKIIKRIGDGLRDRKKQ